MRALVIYFCAGDFVRPQRAVTEKVRGKALIFDGLVVLFKSPGSTESAACRH